MKKTLFSLMALMVSLGASADYQSMQFNLLSGEQRSIPSASLSMRFENGNLVAQSGSEFLSIPISDLSSMEFADKTESAVFNPVVSSASISEVYSVDGKLMLSNISNPKVLNSLPAGIYVVRKSDGSTAKFAVK